jgi:non-specific serine/threonine protein kinase
MGRVDESLTQIDEALRVAMETDYRWYVPEILKIKGELLALRDSNDPATIEDLFRRSMRQAGAQQAAYWELSAAISLAELLGKQRRDEEARAVLAPLYERFAAGYPASRVKQAKALLDRLAAPKA